MSKPLREDVVHRLIDFVFDWVKEGRAKALEKKFASDPELVKMTQELDNLRKRFEARFSKQAPF